MFTKNRRRVDSFVALAIVANGRSNATRFAGKRMRHVVERVEMKNLRILKYFGNGRTGACGTSFSSRRFSHYVRGWVPKIDINSSRKSAQFLYPLVTRVEAQVAREFDLCKRYQQILPELWLR